MVYKTIVSKDHWETQQDIQQKDALEQMQTELFYYDLPSCALMDLAQLSINLLVLSLPQAPWSLPALQARPLGSTKDYRG